MKLYSLEETFNLELDEVKELYKKNAFSSQIKES